MRTTERTAAAKSRSMPGNPARWTATSICRATTSAGTREGSTQHSRMTLVTRERESEGNEACQVVIHGGKIIEVKAAGAAPGTMIEVRQLFYNLPARRKFLRTEETERAHIQHYLTLAALAAPEVAFTFIQDGRVVWQLPAVESGERGRIHALRERMRARGVEERYRHVR